MAPVLQNAFISYVNLMSLGKSQPNRTECKSFIGTKRVQQSLAEYLYIVLTGRQKLWGSEGLHFPSKEVTSFMDEERSFSLSSHPHLPLAILSLSFPHRELLLRYSLCAECNNVIRSSWLAGHPSFSSLCTAWVSFPTQTVGAGPASCLTCSATDDVRFVLPLLETTAIFAVAD